MWGSVGQDNAVEIPEAERFAIFKHLSIKNYEGGVVLTVRDVLEGLNHPIGPFFCLPEYCGQVGNKGPEKILH